MYRILVADDEGIMLEAFKNVIAGAFGEECVVETAKTGRAVTEIAETFHPDVVFMDIHMPGINGIQAMREIRKFNTTALFYVVSAYDKFDYAKEAIDLGVERYLTKPISRAKIIAAVEEAIGKVDAKRNQRSNLLKIQEKLETVIPVVENSFVGSLLFQQEMQAADYYQQADQALADLRGARMTKHSVVQENVYCTEYDSSSLVYVNYGETEATVNGVTIPARSFLRLN